MPESLILDNFMAGWIPDDDASGGRKNGLTQMTNLELDQNGAVIMTGGTKKIGTVYTNTVHTIYSKFVNGGDPLHYLADTSGNIFRGNTDIDGGVTGSLTRAAFAAYSNYVLCLSGDARKRDSGSGTAANLGRTAPGAITAATNGAGVLTGSYEYCQVNVFHNGSWIGKSPRGPITTAVTASANKISVDPVDPTVADADANEAWIFRRGGNLDQFYWVATKTSYAAFDDNMSDDTALQYGISLNEFLTTVAAAGISDPIVGCVGPVYGRMLYITNKAIFFSEIDSPDTYDSRTTINLGSNAGVEAFLWAHKVGENIILIGTTFDIYSITGTYVQQPDGTLDIYHRPMGVEDPPISIDAAVYGGGVAYMSKNGWTHSTLGNLCAPNTSQLYRGTTRYGYGGVPIYVFGSYRYSCCVSGNKLWCRVPYIQESPPTSPFLYRMEVYDFIRKSWRVMLVNSSPLMLHAREDGAVIGFFDGDKFLRQIAYPFAKTLDDGSATKQSILFQTTFQDHGKPENRKDALTIKLKLSTGNDNATLKIYEDDSGSANTITTTLNSNGVSLVTIDISSIGIAKNWRIEISGQLADFILEFIAIDYNLRPLPITHLVFNNNELGLDAFNKKRIGALGFMLDTLGATATLTPTKDGSNLTTSAQIASGKRTLFHYFTAAEMVAFGVDFGGTLNCTTPFEFYGFHPPDVLEALPFGRKNDQIGPIELFRYGKIKTLEANIIAFGGTTIPFAIWCDGVSVETGNLTVTDGIENVVSLNMTKTTAGSIVRIVLGATSFLFHRRATRILVAKSGRATELEWVPLDGE